MQAQSQNIRDGKMFRYASAKRYLKVYVPDFAFKHGDNSAGRWWIHPCSETTKSVMGRINVVMIESRYENFCRRKNLTLLLLLFALVLNAGCEEDFLSNIDNPIEPDDYCVFTDDYYKADPNDTTSVSIDWNHPALEQMRKRAEIIGNIKWTPKGDIPQNIYTFREDVEETGIPYSSVKELDKFVGLEVSFYTFMSAVNNPRSVLYTENVGKSPYSGTNCATYYGTVCSTAVNYVLGIGRPYETRMYGALPFIKRVAQQDLEHAAPGDLVHFLYGHMILITNIVKDNDDSIQYIDILESAGVRTFNRRYTKDDFQERLDKDAHVIYRYMDLDKLATEPFPFPAVEDYQNADMTNHALSLSRGDRVTYSEGEREVTVNVLESGYDKLEVYWTDENYEDFVEEIPVKGAQDIVLSDLRAGSYKAVLTSDEGAVSNAVCFEILQTEVSYRKQDDSLIIHFYSENSTPEYIVICTKNGVRKLITDITKEERMYGCKLIKCKANIQSLYLKVFFKGEYGRVSNPIIPLSL